MTRAQALEVLRLVAEGLSNRKIGAHLFLSHRTVESHVAIALGWAEWHPYVVQGRLPPTVVMAFAPRNEHEAAVIEQLFASSWHFATGLSA